MKILPTFPDSIDFGKPDNLFKALRFPNELRTFGLSIPILLSAESFSVAEQYAVNISLLLRDIPVLEPTV